MSSYLPAFGVYLFVLVAVFTVSYLVGRLMLAIIPGVYRRNDDSYNVYVSLVLGIVLIVSVFAIIWTKGRSIMWIVILLFALYVFDKKCRKSIADKAKFGLSELKYIFLYLLILVLLYVVAYYFLVCRIRLISPYGDPLYYSNLSYRLINNGVESSSVIGSQIGPYHYFENWLNGIVASVFHLNYYSTLFLITYTFLLSLCAMGSYNICKSFIDREWLCVLLGLLFLIFTPLIANVFVYANHLIRGKLFLWGNPALTMFKLSTIFALMICSVNVWMKKNEDFAVCLMLSLVALYSPVSAAVLIFVFMYSIIIWKPFWKNKLLFLNKYSVYCIIVGLFFGAFYFLSGIDASFNSGAVNDWGGISVSGILSSSIKLFVFEILLFIPSIVVLMVCKYIKHEKVYDKNLLMFALVVALTFLFLDLVASVYSQVNIDGSQMATNFAMPLIFIFAFMMYLYIIKKYSKPVGYSLILLPVIMFIILPQRGPLWFVLCGRHDDEFYEGVAQFFDRVKESNDNETYTFGYFNNYNSCNIDGLRWTISYPMSGYMHLLLPDGYYFPDCLSAMDIPEDVNPKFNEKKSSELYKFIEEQKQCGGYINDGMSISDFIISKKINYIIVVKGAQVPLEIKERMKFIAEFDNNEVYKFCKESN